MQYQSLLFSKFEQISANVVFATLLLYFGHPRKSIFSSSDDVQANKNSPRALWKIINRAVPSKENQQSSYTKDLSTIANEFNLFFSKVGQNAAEALQSLMEKNNITARLQLLDTNPSSNTPGLFNLKSVSCEEVHQVI